MAATEAQRKLMAERGYVTAADAAEATGSHISSFYKWVSEGRITGSRIGNHWFVEVESVVRHLSSTGTDPVILKRLRDTLRTRRTA